MRFFIRRGLKIYPSFYFFLFFTVTVVFVARQNDIYFSRVVLSYERILTEIFFLQNYFPNIWGTDWSIAVEEHFYFFMALLTLYLSRGGLINKFIIVSVLVIVLVPILRLYAQANTIDDEPIFHLSTHFRIDSLFSGVLIYCLYSRFHRSIQRLHHLCLSGLLCFGILILIAWFLIFPDSMSYAHPLSFTVIHLAFSIVLISMLLTYKNDKNRVIEISKLVISFVGVHSYNIYLWHLFVIDILYFFVNRYLQVDIFYSKSLSMYFIYIVCSILVGYTVTRVLEIPILAWRDKRFSLHIDNK